MKNVLFLISFLVLSLTSCIQENLHPDFTPDWPAPDPKPEIPKIKTEKSNNEEDTYIYDDKGRQIKYLASTGYRIETTYGNDHMDKMYFNTNGDLTSIFTFDLNAKGLRTKCTRTDVPGTTYYYFYNAADQVIRTETITPVDTFKNFYFYSHENLDSISYTQNGLHKYTYKYFYYNDIPNKIGNEIFGLMYSGKGSKNLLKNWYGTGIDGSVFVTSVCSYTFDDKDRVVSQSQTTDNNSETYFYTYY